MNLATITAGVQAKAGAVDALGNSLKFDFGGEVIHIDGKGDSNVVTNDDAEADCTVKVSMEDFIALSTGELNPMMAFMGGQLQVEGDMSVAMGLQSFFE